jgi:rubrerythrin
MATKTPARPIRLLDEDRTIWEAETSPTTSSRAVKPPVVVENRTMVHHDLGEAFLVWQCDDCGEVGMLTAFPNACPDCGAPREALFYYTED